MEGLRITLIENCLIYDDSLEVEGVNDDTFAGDTKAYHCPRCGKAFSERHPTRIQLLSVEHCTFDK